MIPDELLYGGLATQYVFGWYRLSGIQWLMGFWFVKIDRG